MLGALMDLISHSVAYGVTTWERLCWDRVLPCRLPKVLHREVSSGTLPPNATGRLARWPDTAAWLYLHITHIWTEVSWPRRV